jgi:hypothetical protein
MALTEPSTEVPAGELPALRPDPTPYVSHPDQLYVDTPEPEPLDDEISVPAEYLPADADTDPPPPRHGALLVVALALAGLAGGMVAVTALGAVGWGAQHVSSAQRAYVEARQGLVDCVDEQRPLVDELSAAGATTEELAAALHALNTAPADERVQASLAFVDAARQAARQVPVDDHHTRQIVRDRLARMDSATAGVQDAWIQWTEHAAHPAGQVAVAIGLADAP